MYGEAPVGDTARWRSTAEAERNVPGVRLTRADLGWKSLLFALPELPAMRAEPAGSALMKGQGFAVIRREIDRVYVALDYGHSGGSHGHPDRLNLWLVNGDQRVFEDVGTGSYVERALHWYRSTLAHNAPLVDGQSQEPADGTLRAWDEQDGYSWVDAEAPVAGGVLVRRSVVVADAYLVDRLEWNADRSITLDLPMHVEGDVGSAAWRPAELPGGSGLEDGFDFLSGAETSKGASTPVRITAPGVEGVVHIDAPHDWWRAVAPGPPRKAPRRFLMLRATGERGSIISVWSWSDRIEVNVSGSNVVALTVGGRQVRHEFSGDTWRVHTDDNPTVALNGRQDARAGAPAAPRASVDRTRIVVPRVQRAVTSVGDLTSSREGVLVKLGEGNYRGTEATWTEAGSPTAAVAIAASDRELLIEASVTASDPNFVEARAENPLDNEHPDVNSDGMQIHLTSAGRSASWLMVPEPGSPAVRTTGRDDAAAIPFVASWRRTQSGWELLARIDRSALGFAHGPGRDHQRDASLARATSRPTGA